MKGLGPSGDEAPPADGEAAEILTGAVRLAASTGLHARPIVRVTQRAKAFRASIEIALSEEGPWIDAKSPVQMMRFRAPLGAELVFRTAGPDAAAALQAMLDVVHHHLGEV